mmetsp:Transcript_72986/g.225691  ORF Transcript_72986/g.225691 Transcript_72986/m.225691 type:complete len:209 (+) Transcript_72986:588-1214(+)
MCSASSQKAATSEASTSTVCSTASCTLLRSSTSLAGRHSSAAATCATRTCSRVTFEFPGALKSAILDSASTLKPPTSAEASAPPLPEGEAPKLMKVPRRTAWWSTTRKATLLCASLRAVWTEARPPFSLLERSAITYLKIMSRKRCPTAGCSMWASGRIWRSASLSSSGLPRKPLRSPTSSGVGTALVRISQASALSASAPKSSCSRA